MAFQLRAYAAASGLNRSQIQDRVVEVLKTFEKVSPEKVSFHPNSLASKQERERLNLGGNHRSQRTPASPRIWDWTRWMLWKL